MNLYNKPKIEWDDSEMLHFMGQYIWIEENRKMDNVYYTGIVSLSQCKSIYGDGERCFTEPYADKEKCRAAIEKKCQDLIVQYTVGIELILPPWEGPVDDERWKGINEGLKEANRYMQKQGHITEREASNR
jgi:hypothetical protein